MKPWSEKAMNAFRRLEASQAAELKKRGALEMQAEREFVGYIRREPDGRYSNEVFSWSVCRGTVYGDSIEAVKEEAFRRYGG